MKLPKDLKPVLAKISNTSEIANEVYCEVVWYNDETNEWRSYGTDTFEFGEQVLSWKYVEDCFDVENKILDLIFKYGGIDGSHHKQWLIDQVFRIITGEDYSEWVSEWNDGEDGSETYEWDEGVAP